MGRRRVLLVQPDALKRPEGAHMLVFLLGAAAPSPLRFSVLGDRGYRSVEAGPQSHRWAQCDYAGPVAVPIHVQPGRFGWPRVCAARDGCRVSWEIPWTNM